MDKILVTGATGQVGKAVVDALAARHIPVLAASRNISKIERTEFVEPVELDYATPSTYKGAIDGATGIFLIAPPLAFDAPSQLIPFIESARESGAAYIVFNSAFGADKYENSPLRQVERHLIDSNIDYSIIRPNFFMENFSTGFMAHMIAKGEIALPAGEGRTSFISTRDIANVVSALFLDVCCGTEFNLTGPQALDYAEVARIISDFSDRDVAYRPISEEEMLEHVQAGGVPRKAAEYLAMLFSAVREGYVEEVTNDVYELTGSNPVSFPEFVRDAMGIGRFSDAA